MADPNRYLVHSTALTHPGQALEIEYVRDADWDRRWALVFQGVHCRQEVRRLATFTEAREAVRNHLVRQAERQRKDTA